MKSGPHYNNNDSKYIQLQINYPKSKAQGNADPRIRSHDTNNDYKYIKLQINYPKSKAQGNADLRIQSHDSDALSKHSGNVTQWLEAAFSEEGMAIDFEPLSC